MRGDVGPLPLPADQQVVGRHRVDRLPDRALADAEAARQLAFARDRLARFPLARLQTLRDQGLDLQVERAEGGADRAGDRHRPGTAPCGRRVVLRGGGRAHASYLI